MGYYERFCAVVLAVVGLWLLVTAVAIIIPIICFISRGGAA